MGPDEAWYNSGSYGLGERPALVVIDFQRLFWDPESPFGQPPAIGRAMEGTARLLTEFRARGLTVAYTVVAWRPDGRDAGLWKVKHLTEMSTVGSHWAEVCDEVAPVESDIVIVKKMPSAFFGTELLNVLVTNRCDSLVVTGANTSGCVRATTIESFSLGFKTIVPEDCVGDLTGEEPHRANLFDVHNRYADVTTADEVIAALPAG